LIFAYKILWQEYLTHDKKRNLKQSILGLIAVGTLSSGALVGNYLYDSKRNHLFRSKNLLLKRRQHLIMGFLFTLFSMNYEFIERNLFYFLSSSLTGLGYQFIFLF